MNAAGLIFSNIHDSVLLELTRWRTMASVPFGCRYRLIDFPLSNMVNAEITNVGIITHYNYQSLLDHIGTGKDWDLARRSGGIRILPPFITAYENDASGKVYSTRLEALMGVTNFISRCKEEYIFLSDCDLICNIDLTDVMKRHIAGGADLTIVTARADTRKVSLDSDVNVIQTDEAGRITDCTEFVPSSDAGTVEISTNIMVMKRSYLYNIVADAIAHGYTSFYRDIIYRNMKRDVYKTYRFDGTFGLINSMATYFDCNMRLLEPDQRESLFQVRTRPVYTKVRNSAPTTYHEGSRVVNSYIADGCVIDGEVENSIIFRGVRIGKGTKVKNCILMQNTYTGSNVSLNCVVSDKNVVIKDGRELSGCPEMPFCLPKGAMI